MLETLNLQDFLFEKEVNRMDLMNFKSKTKPSYKISVYRNHSFELIEHTISPYLDYGTLGVTFEYSDYDDSLSFLNLDLDSDLIILWLDLTRYTNDDVSGFINERVSYLQSAFKRNILFVPYGGKADVKSDRVVQYPIDQVEAKLGDKFLDLRMEPFSGTKLSHLANMEISKDLGLNYIPALLRPNLKGIVVDLDNTLYQGVLGEDGVEGVRLTDSHKKLQERLKELSKKGFFLSVASKNDERDVLELFKQRSDFPLQLDDFVKICASWDSKANSIETIAKSLNINPDSLLFIDDNMGELVSVAERHPTINLLWAKENASITLSVLCNYPGLLKLNVKKEDALRKADTIANEKRKALQSSMSREEYIKKLKMELTFDVDNLDQADRVTELSNKTNQFIFSYQRYSLQQILDLMNKEDGRVVTISLKDSLSDSGIIGVMCLRSQGEYIELEECFVSCRALGRGIDEATVLGAIKIGLDSFGKDVLKVNFTKGERNLPAENFKDSHLTQYVEQSRKFNFELPTDLVKVTVMDRGQ